MKSNNTPFKKGDFLILNDSEKPCGMLLCVVIRVKQGQIFCKYLHKSKEFNFLNKRNGLRVDLSDNPTKIEDFGVKVCFSEDLKNFWCEQKSPSMAIYKDGLSRKWQERYPIIYGARGSLMNLIKRYEK